MSRSKHGLLGWGALVLLCVLACASPQATNPTETTAPQDEATQGQEANTPTQPEQPAAQGNAPKSSPATIEHAKALGFPPVPDGAKVIGPFDGPEGSIFYADATGRLSYFVPAQKSAFFGRVNAQGQPEFEYALRPEASYKIEAGQQVKLPAPPQEVLQWPYAEPMVNVMVATLKAHLEELRSQQAQQNADIQTRSFVSRKMHEINMGILSRMGDEGCTKHYEGVYYLGCW